MCQNFRKAEVLEQSDNVREGLVKRQHVRVSGFHEMLVETIEQRMSRLVRNDVVGETGKDHPTGELAGGSILDGRKVAEEERPPLPAVVSICHPKRMWVDAQPLDVTFILSIALRPERLPSERALETVHRSHDHGIDHLLVKLRVPFGRREAVLSQHACVIEVYWCVKAPAWRIEINNFHVFA